MGENLSSWLSDSIGGTGDNASLDLQNMEKNDFLSCTVVTM